MDLFFQFFRFLKEIDNAHSRHVNRDSKLNEEKNCSAGLRNQNFIVFH